MEASVATPGQGAPAAGVQPGAPGQGDAAGQSTAAGKGADAAFNWGNFPDVPVEQQELLEPHLRNVQGHVTKLESQYAPYKGLTESVSPDQVENLLGFLDQYAQDPVSTWLGMAQEMGQSNQLPQGVTFEAIQALMQGQQEQGAPGQQAQPGQEEEVPPWAQELQSRLAQQDQAQQQQQQAQDEAEQAQILDQAKTGIRAQLTQGQITEEQVSDEMVVAAIIANNGDEQAAATMLTQMRQNFLAGFANNQTGGPKEPAVEGKLPGAPKQGKSGRKDPDGFGSEANASARQRLGQAAAAEG